MWVLVQIGYRIPRWKRYRGYEPLQGNGGIDNGPKHAVGAVDASREAEHSSAPDEEPIIVSTHHLSLQQTVSRTQDSVVEAKQPRGEVVLVVLEIAAVAAEVAIHTVVLLMRVWGSQGHVAAIAGLVTWAYILILVTARLLLSVSSRYSFPKLWNHTACLYGFQWLQSTMPLRSAIIHPRSEFALGLTMADFVLVTILLLTALTTRRGNRCVMLEHDKGLEPSQEPLASIFSRATFTWVDPVVWRGYKKNLKLANIWDLPAKDKAASILEDFRQIKY